MLIVMEEPIYQYVLRQLDASKGRLRAVADGSGVPYKTIEKIIQRRRVNPGVLTIQRLYDWFRRA